MKIDLMIPSAGAGKWAWEGWKHGFMELGHSVRDIANRPIFKNDNDCCEAHSLPDLLICSTSSPRDDILKWRKEQPGSKVALNVLASTDEKSPGLTNDGVMAHKGNFDYAEQLKPDICFAQYSEPYYWLLSNWSKYYKIGNMAMACDDTLYKYNPNLVDKTEYDISYAGGKWVYKAQNLDKYVTPLLRKYWKTSFILGKGWDFPTSQECSETQVGEKFQLAKVCLNAHEPHSTQGGWDVVERVPKTIGVGGLCLSDYVEEIEKGYGLINGKHLLMAKTPAEYIELAEDIIINPSKYNQIRKDGMKQVLEHHTYRHRCERLLRDIYGDNIPE